MTFKTPQDVGFPANMNWTSPLVRDYIKDTFEVTYYPDGHMVRPRNPRSALSPRLQLHASYLHSSQGGSR